jgi:hypothetical protein
LAKENNIRLNATTFGISCNNMELKQRATAIYMGVQYKHIKMLADTHNACGIL